MKEAVNRIKRLSWVWAVGVMVGMSASGCASSVRPLAEASSEATLSSLSVQALSPASASISLTADKVVEESPYFEQVLLTQARHPENVEFAKIEYLIDRIRHSENAFIRNGESYSPNVAARFLDWKFQRRKKKIENARDFIDQVATVSSTTGKPYLVLLANGTALRVCDLLFNELNFLENRLTAKR
jgi:hypothetical protein